MVDLSVVIFAKNSERTIERCLESVKFASEIIVIDMGATDQTQELSRSRCHRYLFSKADYVEPVRDWGVGQTKNQWVLVLDADEELSPGLATTCQSYLEKPTGLAVAMARKNIMFGRIVTSSGWWPDYQIRLFKRGAVTWGKQIHRPPQVKGKLDKFKASEDQSIIHHQINSVDEYLDRIRLFTLVEAANIQEKISPELAGKAFFDEFNRRFFLMKGYADSDLGLYLAMLQSFYQFLTKLRLWEQAGYPKQQVKVNQLMGHVLKGLNYWWATYEIESAQSRWKRWWWKIRRRLAL